MKFSLLTLNLRHGQGAMEASGESPWSWRRGSRTMREHAEKLGGFLAKLDPLPDVCCFQEGNAAVPWWPDITAIIQKKIGYLYKAESRRFLLPHNNIILSRLPFANVYSRQFTRPSVFKVGGYNYFTAMNRGYVAAEIPGIGLVVNTHLQPFSGMEEVRFSEARELRTELKRVWDEYQGTIILAGDMNFSGPDDPSVSILENSLSNEKYALHTEPALTKESFKDFTTWPDAYLEVPAGFPASRLDYIFVSKNKKIRSMQRIWTSLTDHAGVLAAIE